VMAMRRARDGDQAKKQRTAKQHRGHVGSLRSRMGVGLPLGARVV
jgi:hypothetical protein